MNEVWNKVYKSDGTFFGEEPSNFALLCHNDMKTNKLEKVLDLGAGHRRDSIFFASNGIEVEALDYSVVAVQILDKIDNVDLNLLSSGLALLVSCSNSFISCSTRFLSSAGNEL